MTDTVRIPAPSTHHGSYRRYLDLQRVSSATCTA